MALGPNTNVSEPYRKRPTLFYRAMGVRIRAAREYRGLEIKDVADRMRVGRSLVAMWERGERRLPVESVAALSASLGCSPLYVLGLENLLDTEQSA